MKQFITVPPNQQQVPTAYGWDKITASAETVIKHFAGMNTITPYDANRKVDHLTMATSKDRGINIPWRSRFSKLDEELYNIGAYTEVGYKIYADVNNNKWIFDTVHGTDRTKSQTIVDPVFFNLEYQNVESYKYAEDRQNFKNVGYAGGQGEDEKRLIYVIGAENKGLQRHEIFLDCGSAADITELIYYGSQKLSEYQEVKSIEASTLPRVFQFEKDYFLGDKVSVYISRLGLKLDTQITSVTEIWERATGYRADIRFGARLPNLFSVLNQSREVR